MDTEAIWKRVSRRGQGPSNGGCGMWIMGGGRVAEVRGKVRII